MFVAADLAQDLEFTEVEAVTILANYGQVRLYLHKKSFNRGFFRSKAHEAKGKSRGSAMKAITDRSPPKIGSPTSTGRPQRWFKSSLIARTKCARCGKIGHWARICTNPPDERSKRRQDATSGTHFPRTYPLGNYSGGVSDSALKPATFCQFGGTSMEAFVGLSVSLGMGFIDRRTTWSQWTLKLQKVVCPPRRFWI